MNRRRTITRSVSERLLLRPTRKAITLWGQVFERRASPSDMSMTLSEMIEVLSAAAMAKIRRAGDTTCCYRTKLRSRRCFPLFPQARLAVCFANMYMADRDERHVELATGLSNYLLLHQEEDGLFLFQKPRWSPKDEGIMTYVAMVALLSTYAASQDERFLSAAIRSGESGRSVFYREDRGYIHTIGHQHWCLNVSAVAAYAYLLLHRATGQQRYFDWAREGLTFITKHIRPDGLFPYSMKQRGVYLTAYHAIVMYYVARSIEIHGDAGASADLVGTLDRARAALLGLVRSDGSIVEPDTDHYAALNSLAASSAVLSMREGDEEVCGRVLRFMPRFFVPGSVYLYMNRERLYCGYHRMFQDFILTEVLLWLVETSQNLASHKTAHNRTRCSP